MTLRSVKTIPELNMWLREFCKFHLHNDYQIRIQKHTNPNGEITFMIEDKVYSKWQI